MDKETMKERKDNMQNIAYLSLFLMLLTFFIYFYTLSEIEASRSFKAIHSLQKTFGQNITPASNSRTDAEIAITASLPKHVFFQKLHSIWQRQVKDDDLTLYSNGVMLELQQNQLYRVNESGFRENMLEKLVKTINLVGFDYDDYDVETKIIFSVPDNVLIKEETDSLENSKQEKITLLNARLNSLSQEFLGANVNPSRVISEIDYAPEKQSPSKGNDIRLYIRLYPKINYAPE